MLKARHVDLPGSQLPIEIVLPVVQLFCLRRQGGCLRKCRNTFKSASKRAQQKIASHTPQDVHGLLRVTGSFDTPGIQIFPRPCRTASSRAHWSYVSANTPVGSPPVALDNKLPG